MRMSLKAMRSCIAGAVLALLALPSTTLAQDMVTIPTGTTKAILKYNVCRMVKNTTGASILVPLGSSGEWTGGSSFIQHAPNFTGVNVTACMPGGGNDASLCITHQRLGGINDSCGSATWRVSKQSSFLPVSVDDVSEWAAAISWAANNLGQPASARPANILPACYTNSSMNELSRVNSGYVPPGSDFCISYYDRNSVPMNSSSGPEWTAGVRHYYRIWR